MLFFGLKFNGVIFFLFDFSLEWLCIVIDFFFEIFFGVIWGFVRNDFCFKDVGKFFFDWFEFLEFLLVGGGCMFVGYWVVDLVCNVLCVVDFCCDFLKL